MLELVAKHGLGFKPPSYHEIRVKWLVFILFSLKINISNKISIIFN